MRLIDADALQKIIENTYLEGDSKLSFRVDGTTEDTLIGKFQTIDIIFDMPTVDVLEQIRAEIEQITDTMGVSYNQYVSKIDVLQIIDKYKGE